jgi:zinc D-Ala-D-Ala carboxypeptidase
MARYLTKHFTLEEMTFSQTAARLGIDNVPAKQVVDHLRLVCEALEALRDAVGGVPIHVSSGYRSPALNDAVNGAKNSQHMYGLAVDFTIPGFGSTLQVARTVAASGVQFDQVIHEYGRWVHLGLAEPGQPVRGEKLSIFTNTGYLAGLRAAPATA